MRTCGLFALTLCFCAALPLDAGNQPGGNLWDWPQWRGPRRDGVSLERGLLTEWPKEGPKLLWDSKQANGKKSVGRGYSAVSVAGGKVFTQGDRDQKGWVFALDLTNGKHIWATAIGPSGGDGPQCTPTVDGDYLYALTRQGNLVCLKSANGEIVWTKHFGDDFGGHIMSSWDYSESPLVDGNKLIVTPGGDDAALVALDKRTGATLWKSEIKDAKGAGYASPVIAEAGGVRQYITLLGRGIVGVDAKDGKLLWRYNKVTNGTANIPTAIVKGDLVFTSTGYGTGSVLLQLIPKDGGIEAKELYFLKGNKLQNHHGGLILVGDHIYGGHGHNEGLPFCLEMKTGKLVWGPVRGAGERSAAVVFADGHLYFRYENGVMALVEATPTGYNLKGSFELPKHVGTPSWPHPVVANGCLLIRGNDCVLCYDVKQK